MRGWLDASDDPHVPVFIVPHHHAARVARQAPGRFL